MALRDIILDIVGVI